MLQTQPTCPNCNTPISVNAKFCRACGKPIEIPKPEPVQSPSLTRAPSEPTCSHCGALISPTAKFCRECGSAIEPIQASAPTPTSALPSEPACPHCGATISPTAKFCITCGNAITATRAATISTIAPALNSNPPAPTKPPRMRTKSSPPVKHAQSKTPMLLMGCVAIPLLCLLVLVGGYFAFRSGAISQKTLLNLVGIGPGSITWTNYRDDTIQINVTQLKEVKEGEAPATIQDLSLNAYDSSIQEMSQGKYRVEFRRQDTEPLVAEACILTIHAGDSYELVALPNGVLVYRENSPSMQVKDLDVETSSFCR